jgi:hypothetical protein
MRRMRKLPVLDRRREMYVNILDGIRTAASQGSEYGSCEETLCIDDGV